MNTDAAAAKRLPVNIVLIGYRGCGKSTVGRTLAARLGWTFVDTDERIEAQAGRTIRAIFEKQGEVVFRRIESDVIDGLVGGRRQVLSVGGGAVLAEENRRQLMAAGVCVWLTAPAAVLLERMAADARSAANRPALTARNPLDEVQHLLKERSPLYAALAQHVVDTAGRSVAEIVDDIIARL